MVSFSSDPFIYKSILKVKQICVTYDRVNLSDNGFDFAIVLFLVLFVGHKIRLQFSKLLWSCSICKTNTRNMILHMRRRAMRIDNIKTIKQQYAVVTNSKLLIVWLNI